MLTFLLLSFILSVKKSESGFVQTKRLQIGEFPYLIQFQTISACGGVLLTPDWVLTAAQCVMFKRSAIFVHLAGSTGRNARAIGVKATYIHPDYDFYTELQDFAHNIALLKLSEPYEISKNNKPLQIGPLRMDDNYKSCLVFGWQSTVFPTSRVFAKPVQYIEVLPNAWRICTYAQGMYGSISNRENIFCGMIESDEGLKACAGNPGSPVVCENQYGRRILLGIASWTNYSLYCDGLPTYLSVAPFSSWIYNLILSTDRPSVSEPTPNIEAETRIDSIRGDLGEFERTEETGLDGLGQFDDYRDFRRHYEDPLQKHEDDSQFFYVSSAISVHDVPIFIWMLLTRNIIYCFTWR